jgi:hypothetical protein
MHQIIDTVLHILRGGLEILMKSAQQIQRMALITETHFFHLKKISITVLACPDELREFFQ